jgi:hypothetical protein
MIAIMTISIKFYQFSVYYIFMYIYTDFKFDIFKFATVFSYITL